MSINTLLTIPVEREQAWSSLFEVFNELVQAHITYPIDQLEARRFIDYLIDVKELQHTIRMLGFDEDQDLLDINASSLVQLVNQLPLYPDYNSTVLFPNFIDVLLGGRVQVTYLYTQDYVNFYDTHGTLITEGGNWFKTTHINLDISLYSVLAVDAQTLIGKTLSIFYSFDPITLVVKSLAFVIYVNDTTPIIGVAAKQGNVVKTITLVDYI